MRELENYFDSWDLIAQGHPSYDGGDTCHRMGMYHFGIWVWKQKLGSDVALWPRSSYMNAAVAFDKLECPEKPNNYRRHPDPKKWYSKPNVMSRDQSIPLVVAIGALDMRERLWGFFLNHLKRGLLFTHNTIRNFQYPTLEEHKKLSTPDVIWDYSWKLPDLTGPEFWGLYIRGFHFWLLYPLLIFFDIQTLITAIQRRFDNDTDVSNHTIISCYGHYVMPTPTMWLANRINDPNILMEKLRRYFLHPDPIPMVALYRPIVWDVMDNKTNKWWAGLLPFKYGKKSPFT